MSEPLTFQECLEKFKGGNASILLGNGFSIAGRKVFQYNRLFELADLPPRIRQIFELIETSNFEHAMRTLQQSAALLPAYGDNSKLCAELAGDADEIRACLIRAIGEHHPESPLDIAFEEYQSCGAFLQHFHKIFTVNYDLLLYWTIMREGLFRQFRDGFQPGVTEPLIWSPDNTDPNLFYLHGALHLFDVENGPLKLKFGQEPLIDQVKQKLSEGRFPLLVSEGASSQKRQRVSSSPYLTAAGKALEQCHGVLYSFGFSFSPNDDRISDLIARSPISTLCVSIKTSQGIDERRRIKERVYDVATHRTELGGSTLEIVFWDAASAKVWDAVTPPKSLRSITILADTDRN